LLVAAVTPPALGWAPVEYSRWQQADLVLEGRITRRTTLTGETFDEFEVDRVLKPGFLLEQPYTKGTVSSRSILLPPTTLPTHTPLRVYLKQEGNKLRLLGVEEEKRENPLVWGPGVVALAALAALASTQATGAGSATRRSGPSQTPHSGGAS